VISPRARLAAAAALPSALIRGAGGRGIGPAREPPGVDLPHVVGHGLRFFHLSRGRGLGLLLRQWTRMPHDKAPLFLHAPLITLLHLHLPHDALPMPAAGRFRLGPPRFLYQQGQGELLLSPGFEGLPYGTGARDECDQVDLVRQTHAQRAATLGLTLRHNPTHPLQTQRQTCLNRERRFHTITPVAITNADASGEAPISSHAETEEHLCEIVPPVFAMPIGWPRGPRGLRVIRIRPIERNGRGVLMHPGGRDGIHGQRFEDDGALHLVQMGRKQGLEDVSQPIIMERGPCEARLQQRHHAPFFQPLPHLIESMIAIQNREDQSFDPTPTREHMRRVGGDEAVNDGRDLQAP
jgi:hypothetical protein